MSKKKKNTIREAVGLFSREKKFQAAIDELQSSGFDQSEISVLPASEVLNGTLKNKIKSIEDIEDNPEIPRSVHMPKETLGDIEGAVLAIPLYIVIAFVAASIVMSGGSILSAILLSSITGIIVVAISIYFIQLLSRRRQNYMNIQKRMGGIILWVKTKNKLHEKKAIKILQKNDGRNVHIHDMPI